MDTTGAVCNWGEHHARDLAVVPKFDGLKKRAVTDEIEDYAATERCPTFKHQCRFAQGAAGAVECILPDCICLSEEKRFEADDQTALIRIDAYLAGLIRREEYRHAAMAAGATNHGRCFVCSPRLTRLKAAADLLGQVKA